MTYTLVTHVLWAAIVTDIKQYKKHVTTKYYDTNVGGTFILAEVMRDFG